MIVGSKNKGDWGEFYALVYLLANSDINGSPYKIKKIMKDEYQSDTKTTNHMKFMVLEEDDVIEIYRNSEPKGTIYIKDCREVANEIKKNISTKKGQKFDIESGDKLLKKLGFKQLSAPSSVISDIQMTVYNENTYSEKDMGFSIKSFWGGKPHLLNASPATNLIYEVKDITDSEMETVNNIVTEMDKLKNRINQINVFGGKFEFTKTTNDVFHENLGKIDFDMERIIAEMLIDRHMTATKSCKEVLEHIKVNNPLNYKKDELECYTKKFKKFLFAKTMGMQPSEEWNGEDESFGGLIVVKSNGELLIYFSGDRENFVQYLLDNTKFENGSVGKHDFGYLYKENDKKYLKLNLAIRFK